MSPPADPAGKSAPARSTPPARATLSGEPETTSASSAEPTRLTARFVGWLRTPEVTARFLSSLLLSASFVALVDAYTRGRLLYGVDFVGIYTPSGFFLNPSVNYVVPAIASALTFGDIYSAQYLGFFLDTFLTVFACQSFARELFRPNFPPRALFAVQLLAAGLYLINPYTLTWGLISITTSVFVSSAAFFVVMQMTLRFVRAVLRGRVFRTIDAAVLGLAIGCSAPVSFPNVVRVLATESIAFLLAIGSSWYFGTRPEQRAAFRRGIVAALTGAAPVAAVLLAYPIYTFANVWFSHPGALASVTSQFSSTLSNTTYNTFGNVVRLLSRRQFYRFAYYGLYTGNTPEGLASYLWPVLGVLAPLLIAVFRQSLPGRRLFLLLLGVVFACLVWGSGTLPPFGPVNAILLTPFPVLSTIVPTFFLEALIETKLYAVFAAFTIGMLGMRFWFHGSELPGSPAPVPEDPGVGTGVGTSRPPPSAIRRWTGVVASLALVGLLLVAATPILDGSAEVDSIGAFVPGFVVPPSYFDVRNILHSSGGNAMLLPGVSPYVQTSWGFEGATLFYLSFNYPNKIVVPGFYGAYQIYLPSTAAAYSNATRPLVPAATPPVDPGSLAPIQSNLLNGLPNYNYRVGPSLNTTGHEWVELRLHYSAANASTVASLLAGGTLWVGLRSHGAAVSSPSVVGWYVVSPTYDAVVAPLDATDTAVFLLVGQYSSGAGYDATNVTAVSLWLHQPGVPEGTPLPFTPITLSNGGNSVVSASWVHQMSVYGVRYVLIDQSLVHGTTEPTDYANATVAALEAEALATPAYISPELQLYKLV
jgi:hypothetical protein